MKATQQIVAGLLACALTLTVAARAEDAAISPVQLVNTLQNAQGEIAQGDSAAYAAQPKLLREISEAFSAAKPEVWQKSRNAHAAVIYLLSGGQPRVVTRLLEGGNLPKDDENLIRGALAYELGHETEARQLLGALDPKSLELTLGGQVAFVQSILLTTVDARKAVGLLDLARLLSPGGLVEEAALRREVALVGDIARDADKFMALAGQYMSRFPKSPYADNFLKSFTTALLRLQLAEDVANFPKFESMTANLGRDDRRGLFLTIARTALVSGKIAMADVAASKALTLAAADSADAARGRLYQAAGRTLTDQYESGVAELQAIDPKKLPKRDAALLAAARTVAMRVREATNAASAAAAPTAAPNQPDDSASATIHLAEAALLRAQSVQSAGAP
jgi:chemotaxis protein MotC